MVSAKEYDKMKKELEKLKSDYEQTKGRLASIQQRLKDEFNCGSIKEASKLLEQMEVEHAEAEVEFKKSYAKFMKVFGDVLDVT